jgi:hypothetical protein
LTRATADKSENIQLRETQENQRQSPHSLPNDDTEKSLIQRRSRVAAGSSSSFMCTNLKHLYLHGYQVFYENRFALCAPDHFLTNALFTKHATHDTLSSQGTIAWERWQLEEFLQARKRVCRISNLCWVNGRLTMSCPPTPPFLSPIRHCASATRV